MYQNLIADAKNEGIITIIPTAIIQNERHKILLVEERDSLHPHYRFPSAPLQEKEGIPQALERAILQETSMELKEVISYLGHFDTEKKRVYYFIVEVKDPYAIETQAHLIYAWVEPREAIGYPISDEVRHVIDLYLRFSKG